jgi:hypothetical protein
VLPFLSLLRNLVRRRRVEIELDEELRSCLELLVEEKIAHGMSERNARRTARIELGGIDQVKESVRDVRRGATVEQFWQDLHYASPPAL